MPAGAFPSAEPDRLELDLRVTWDDDVATIAVSGDVDHHTCRSLRGVVNGALAAGARSLVLDCSDVPFMDSGGLSVLADAAAHAGRRDGAVEVRGAHRGVRRILEVCGLDQVVSVTDGRPHGVPHGEG